MRASAVDRESCTSSATISRHFFFNHEPDISLYSSFNSTPQDMSFGILTLATPSDWRKAIGLALSVRVSNPGVPLAVACSPKLRPALAPHFDIVVDEIPDLRGFVHKVYLDGYSPFDDTFFFDSDVLVFRNLSEKAVEWNDQVYNACGIYCDEGFSAFGFDRAKARQRLGKGHFVEIGGAGHAYFRKPGCQRVFDLAREISHNYAQHAGEARYADEDAMNIVLTMLEIRPRPYFDFFSRHLSAVPGTLVMDASAGRCEMIEKSTKAPLRPYMMHFAANEAPFVYARQLHRLFRKFGVDTSGLFSTAVYDFWERDVKLRSRTFVSRLLDARHAS
jgi:hypothetical protein